jgi:hypothetical protein
LRTFCQKLSPGRFARDFLKTGRLWDGAVVFLLLLFFFYATIILPLPTNLALTRPLIKQKLPLRTPLPPILNHTYLQFGVKNQFFGCANSPAFCLFSVHFAFVLFAGTAFDISAFISIPVLRFDWTSDDAFAFVQSELIVFQLAFCV